MSAIIEDHWRRSTDYRYEYFKHNPGILGFIWWCSQCGKPLLGKKNVQVDHGIPPSKFANKKYDKAGNLVKNNSLLARALNTQINLVACCAECNRKKSDKIGGVVTSKAVIAKVLETGVFSTQKGFTLALGLSLRFLYFFLRFIFTTVLPSIFRAGTKPLRSKQKWQVKMGYVAIWLAFFAYIYSRLR